MMKLFQADIKYESSYQEFDLNSLKLDDILVFNIFIQRDNNFVIIIEAGTKLTETLQKKLQNQDKLFISKKEEHKQEFTAKNLFTYIKYNQDDLKKSLSLLYEINNTLFSDFIDSDDNFIDLESVQEIVKSIVYLIDKHPNYLRDTIIHFSDTHILSNHSLHVSIYSISLGYLLGLEKSKLIQLGIAGLLHDVGTKQVNDDIKNKDSKLTLEELEAVHQHPKYSCEIVKKNHLHDPHILDAIMHHHECYDGTGYPEHLPSKEISDFASILSICDIFDALTNKRPYRDKHTTFEALKIMMQDPLTVNKLNQRYLNKFLHSFMK